MTKGMSSNDEDLPQIYLARHGETEWSASGRHTGMTDLALIESGEHNARRLGRRLETLGFANVLTSPLKRAAQTCALAGFGAVADEDRDLVEWDYGAYECITTDEVRKQRPGWEVFRDGCPDGESPAEIGARADRVIGRLRGLEGNTLVFSHGHFLRVLAARWLGLEPAAGSFFFLDTAALSILGYEHGRTDPVVRLWNDAGHAGG